MRNASTPSPWLFALAAAPVAVGAIAWALWLAPKDPDEWFPMRVGDRWTYRDGNGGPDIVFEAVAEKDRLLGEPAFLVERRIGRERIDFVISATPAGVWVLGTTGGNFSPPFEEFRLPPVKGDQWEYRGHFGGRPIRIVSRVAQVVGDRCVMTECPSESPGTTFELRKGVGVVRLTGKRDDIHAPDRGGFDWTLKEFVRK